MIKFHSGDELIQLKILYQFWNMLLLNHNYSDLLLI